ncbi:hypothetical protein BV134_1108 [Haemophilus influenzae]|nr:hypothetical protein BV131_1107 [Haemophilus influenzae]AVJ05138.1 hypothetical protein BV134_1108 [Haemophilus influenzae]
MFWNELFFSRTSLTSFCTKVKKCGEIYRTFEQNLSQIII